MTTWLPIVDVSEHQGYIDFRKMHANGVAGVILRVTNGTRIDRRFREHYSGALLGGFQPDDIAFYSFINPKRADAETAAKVTAETIVDVTGRTDVGMMLDVESYRNEYPNPGAVTLRGVTFADFLRRWRATLIGEMPGCRVFGYTNRAYWNSGDGPGDDDLAGELDWIVPRYPLYSTQSYIMRGFPPSEAQYWDEYAFKLADGPHPPVGADGWQGWQFSAGYNRQGPIHGCQSSDLDLNIVDADAWARWTGTTTPEEDDMPGPVYLLRPPAERAGRGSFFVQGGSIRHANPHDVTWCQDNGIEEVVADVETYDIYFAQIREQPTTVDVPEVVTPVQPVWPSGRIVWDEAP